MPTLLRKLCKSATLLRKLCESASLKRSGSNSNPTPSSERAPSPLGAFDPLPLDILMQIVRLLGPKHAAKLSLVSKSWRSLVSDNALWTHFLQTHHPHSVHFAETALSSGYPLPTLAAQNVPPVSFQHVYALRERLPPSVVIDGGSGYCKFGWTKDASPSGRFATFLEFGNIETPMYTRLRHFFGTIYNRMQVKPSSQPVIVSIPICYYDVVNSDRYSSVAERQWRDAVQCRGCSGRNSSGAAAIAGNSGGADRY
ncbi:Actin-related protein 8, partial [Mucuna pruriens]